MNEHSLIAEILRWTASISGTVAAMMIAANMGRQITGYGFVIFVGSSALWIMTGYITGLASLAFQNSVLLAINVLGAYRWLIAKTP